MAIRTASSKRAAGWRLLSVWILNTFYPVSASVLFTPDTMLNWISITCGSEPTPSQAGSRCINRTPSSDRNAHAPGGAFDDLAGGVKIVGI
jgi:hypothetical protein